MSTIVLKYLFYSLSVLTVFVSINTQAQPIGKETQFVSPYSVTEKCIAVDKFPAVESNYSASDIKEEEEFCAIDLYNTQVALCPKTWSTSPGTMVYDITGSKMQPTDYEAVFCKKGNQKVLAKFKQTMNQVNTSGTFSPSSLLYYHFSRYFDAEVYVPVAVYRSMDRRIHLERIVSNGLKLSPKGMIYEGWIHLQNGDRDPNTYRPKEELYTDNDRQIFGIFIQDKGERYKSEINGTRKSGWGLGQNLDFQKTAPFTALKTPGELLSVLPAAIDHSFKDSQVRAETLSVANEQMIFWMQELTEIALLDYIFGQQDRVGNIDYRWYWYWMDASGQRRRQVVSDPTLKSLPRSKMSLIQKNVPVEIASFNPVLLQRTQLNDNDAGARNYANFAEKAKMLDGLRHYNANLYKRLIGLSKDFQTQGVMYNYVLNNFGISQSQAKKIIQNTLSATAILNKLCRSGELKFDLNPKGYFESKRVVEEKISCD